MAKSPRASNTAATRARKAMLDLAEAVALATLMHPDSQKRYERASKSKRGKPRVLRSFGFSDDGFAAVHVQPGSNLLRIEIHNAGFRVEITSAYDLLDDSLIQPEFTCFEGDEKLISRHGRRWCQELEADSMPAWNPLDQLMGLLGGLEAAAGAEDATDAELLERMANNLARQFARGDAPPTLNPLDESRLLNDPNLVVETMLGAIRAISAPDVTRDLRSAWHNLLVTQLTHLTYAVDRGHDWPRELIAACQRHLIAAGRGGEISVGDFAMLVSAFGEARIEINEDMRLALAGAVAEDTTPDTTDQRGAYIANMMDEMAAAIDDPFAVVAAMSEATRVLPSEAGGFLAHEFVHSPHQVLRDAAPLLLLAEDRDTRRSAAAALEQVAHPDTLSPASLRRMIAIRNWLPHADRPALDLAIRKARLKGVECAAWPATDDLAIHATTIDGAGASSLLFTSVTGRMGVLAGLLVKLTTGIADAWFETEVPRRVLRGMLQEMASAAETSVVDRPYADRLLQHAIARNVETGKPANAELLRAAELVGGSDWQDRRIDIPAEAAALFEALPEDRRTKTGIEQAHRRSASWFGRQSITETWYLDDHATRQAIKRVVRLSPAKQIDRLMVELLPAYRAEWAERMVLLALRAVNAHDTRQRARGPDFVIVAHALVSDMPLSDIPMMREITRLTLQMSELSPY